MCKISWIQTFRSKIQCYVVYCKLIKNKVLEFTECERNFVLDTSSCCVGFGYNQLFSKKSLLQFTGGKINPKKTGFQRSQSLVEFGHEAWVEVGHWSPSQKIRFRKNKWQISNFRLLLEEEPLDCRRPCTTVSYDFRDLSLFLAKQMQIFSIYIKKLTLRFTRCIFFSPIILWQQH